MKYNILIDVGGTGIKAGFCNKNGEISEKFLEFPSNSNKDKNFLITHFCNICEEVFNSIDDNSKTLASLCCAFPGPFDYEKGIPLLKGLSKYESIYGINLQKEMTDKFKQSQNDDFKNGFESYRFINDVSAYSLGVCEHYKLDSRVMYLCIGTGSGSAFTVDSRISVNEKEGIPKNGWVYPIKFKDSIIDDYISARGIENLCYKNLGVKLSSKELSISEYSEQIFNLFGQNLSKAVTPILEKFSADTLVLGGKISKSYSLFKKDIEATSNRLGVRIIIEPNTSLMTYIGLSKHLMQKEQC